MKVIGLSALRTGRPNPPGNIPDIISVSLRFGWGVAICCSSTHLTSNAKNWSSFWKESVTPWRWHLEVETCRVNLMSTIKNCLQRPWACVGHLSPQSFTVSNSSLDTGRVMNASSLSLYPKQRDPVCLRVGLGGCGKISPLPRPDPQTVQPVASHCTDWAIDVDIAQCFRHPRFLSHSGRASDWYWRFGRNRSCYCDDQTTECPGSWSLRRQRFAGRCSLSRSYQRLIQVPSWYMTFRRHTHRECV
jgi:hypothetical protein